MVTALAQSGHLSAFDSIFDQSYERVKKIKKNNKNFFDAFYDIFRDSSPIVEKHFQKTDMHQQKKMLEKSFYSLFIFYATNNANDYLDKIAVRHSKQNANVPPELYDLWMDSLVKTVAEYDPEFDEDVEVSWRIILSSGITYMKFKYNK